MTLSASGYRFIKTTGSLAARLANPAVPGAVLLAFSLFAAREFAQANFHIGLAAATFCLLALVILLAIDSRCRFRRSWHIVPSFTAISCILAVLPLPGHPLTSVSPVLVLHGLPAALSYACFFIAIALLIDVHAASSQVAKGTIGEDETPVLRMETKAFITFYCAFGILTFTLLSGFILSSSFDFNHKNIFAALTWLCSIMLIAGRLLWGWRGSTALRWLGTSLLFLALSYFGTAFVYDILLAGRNLQ